MPMADPYRMNSVSPPVTHAHIFYLFYDHALLVHPIFGFEVLIGHVGHRYSYGYLIDGGAWRSFISLILTSFFARMLT